MGSCYVSVRGDWTNELNLTWHSLPEENLNQNLKEIGLQVCYHKIQPKPKEKGKETSPRIILNLAENVGMALGYLLITFNGL